MIRAVAPPDAHASGAVRGAARRGTGGDRRRREPESADDVSRAVTAAALLKERRVVITPAAASRRPCGRGEHDRSASGWSPLSRPQAAEPAVSAPAARRTRRWSTPPLPRRRTRRLGAARADRRRGSRSAPSRSLSDDELLELPVLYRATLVVAVGGPRDLARPRADQLSRELCTRAYFYIYGVPHRPGGSWRGFFAHGWPRRGAAPVARDAGLRSR